MPWQELIIDLTPGLAGAMEDALLEQGALSITLRDAADQPLLEPAPDETPLWDQITLTAMFEQGADAEAIFRQACAQLDLREPPPHRLQALADREWTRTWLEHFKPMRFGQRLWICPSEYDRPSQADAVVIELDPGLAFGTGTHPTTALCLRWLDANPPREQLVIDYGCGSGILAIAAAKLGARRVIAVDNDPQALTATAENARRNQVSAQLEYCLPDALPDIRADLVLANILLGPLLALKPVFHAHLRAAGQLVLAGLLNEQQVTLEQHYRPEFAFQACEALEDWVRLDWSRN